MTTFLKFGMVGAIGFAIDAAVFFALVHGAGWPWLAARAAAFLSAVGATWAGNRRLTFRSAAAPGGEGLRYLAVQGLGCAANYLAFVGFVALLGSDRWLIAPYLAGTAAGLAVNYSLSRSYVFRPG